MANESFFTVNILPSEVNRYDFLEGAAMPTADWLALPAGAGAAMVAAPNIGDCYTFLSASADGDDRRYEVQVLIPNQAAFPLRLTLSGFRIGGTVYPFDELNEDPEYGNSGASWTNLPHGLRSLAAIAYRHNQTWTDALQITFVAFFFGPLSGTVPSTTIPVELLYSAAPEYLMIFKYPDIPPSIEGALSLGNTESPDIWAWPPASPQLEPSQAYATFGVDHALYGWVESRAMPGNMWNPDLPDSISIRTRHYSYPPAGGMVDLLNQTGFVTLPKALRIGGVTFEIPHYDNGEAGLTHTFMGEQLGIANVERIYFQYALSDWELSYTVEIFTVDNSGLAAMDIELQVGQEPQPDFWTGFVNTYETA